MSRTNSKPRATLATRLLALALSGLFLMPSPASSNYLYEVLPPDLQPYVLLIVDNSGSMLCQDGLYDEMTGAKTYKGLYQQEGESCNPNYCRRNDGSELWVCPDLTEAQADDPDYELYNEPTCETEETGPWCNTEKTVCEGQICSDCWKPCIETEKGGIADCGAAPPTCKEFEKKKINCKDGECLAWGTKKDCQKTTCKTHVQVPGPDCERYEQVKTDCLEYHQVQGDNCLEYRLVDGNVCEQREQIDGPDCQVWNMVNDQCLEYGEKTDGCNRFGEKNGVCLERPLKNGTCKTCGEKWVKEQYTTPVCINWEPRTGSSGCTGADCRNNRCSQPREVCVDTTTCETYGPEYGCEEETYDCGCRFVGPSDNKQKVCDVNCKTRQINCQRDCTKYKQTCTNVCDQYSWEACTQKSEKELKPGTGIWVPDCSAAGCQEWNRIPDMSKCDLWERIEDRTKCEEWNWVTDYDNCLNWSQKQGSCRTFYQVEGPACERWNQVESEECIRWDEKNGPECKTWKWENGSECEKFQDIDGEECLVWNEECKDVLDPDNCTEHEQVDCDEVDSDKCLVWNEPTPLDCDVCVARGPQECDPASCVPNCWNETVACDCPSRMDVAQDVLTDLIPGLDNVTLGLARYGKFEAGRAGELASDNDTKNCGVRLDDPLPASDRSSILSRVSTMIPEGGTPIAKSLRMARDHMEEVAKTDPSATCRGYYVILVTDGEESCSLDENWNPNQPELEKAVRDLRSIDLGNSESIDVRTFILGFGPELAGDNPEQHSLSELARIGGTAESDGVILKPAKGQPSPRGTALFALEREELVAKLRRAFETISSGEFAAVAPVIGSVPQNLNEFGRVSRNFLAYSTFRQPGSTGHLYGIRLFEETVNEETGGKQWMFTDLSHLDLDRCGEEGNACLFDAGRRLTNRTKARKIFTGSPSGAIEESGGFTIPLTDGGRRELSNDSGGYGELGDVFSEYSKVVDLEELLSEGNRPPNVSEETAKQLLELASSPTDQASVVRWLHGEGREWKLGDVYHGGPAIVGPPPYDYRTRGYDKFRMKLRHRPEMIYVGANDGMIHAFHAGPKLFDDVPHDWAAGDEAWAYLPVSMLARASSVILDSKGKENRFFSQDLSCRIDDVLVKDMSNDEGELECGDDELCGWRTILLCGQGWGGSWFVALDVSDPFDPKPMWESTVDGLHDSSNGLGRTWSVPTVALLNLAEGTSAESDAVPTWAAVYGSGYNADVKDHDGNSYPAYRMLNLPFAGPYAYHGNGTSGEDPHVFVQNLADGRFLETFHQHEGVNLGSVVADIPLLDVDGDGFTDVAYVGGWASQLGRISFGKVKDGEELVMPLRTHRSQWTNSCSVFEFGGDNPITNSPTALVDPMAKTSVYLFAGSGVDRGSFPDEKTEVGSEYGFSGFYFNDDGSDKCPEAFDEKGVPAPLTGDGNLCTAGDDGAIQLSGLIQTNTRLLGSPLLSLQANRDKWLSFTTWNPDQASTCAEGTASLYCLNVRDRSRCVPCNYLTDDSDKSGKVDLGKINAGQKIPSPVSADGQVYVLGAEGLTRIGNQTGKETNIAGVTPSANQNAPRQVVISWREIFEE